MITCSYCGRQNEETASRCVECQTEFPAPISSQDQKPAPIPLPKLIDTEALAPAFSFDYGFHRVDWKFVRQWIESELDSTDWEQAWNEAAFLWAGKLRDDLGGDYEVFHSSQTILLCGQAFDTARWLLDYADRATTTITEHLGPTAWHGAFGKDLVLVFSEQDDYYQYVAHHLPDGENPASSGMCIYSGYTHIALPWRDQFDTANAIIHELVHDCLARLPLLPVWLNEGVAVTLERAIGPAPRPLGEGDPHSLYSASINWRAPMMWDELAERHFAFWNEANIQSFWAGTSFHVPGDSNELSYSLAQVFVKLLHDRAQGETFRVFLDEATQDDAGQTAAMDIIGIDLGDVAGEFLGEGCWRPQRRALKACWEAVGWKQQ